MSVGGGYITFLVYFMNVNHLKKMSEFEVVYLNETYSVLFNARLCAVERMDNIVTAWVLMMAPILQY